MRDATIDFVVPVTTIDFVLPVTVIEFFPNTGTPVIYLRESAGLRLTDSTGASLTVLA